MVMLESATMTLGAGVSGTGSVQQDTHMAMWIMGVRGLAGVG